MYPLSLVRFKQKVADAIALPEQLEGLFGAARCLAFHQHRPRKSRLRLGCVDLLPAKDFRLNLRDSLRLAEA
jgi:hypothetical protein